MKRILSLFVLLVSMITFAGCSLLDSETTITFTNLPKSVYTLDTTGASETTAANEISITVNKDVPGFDDKTSGSTTLTLTQINGIQGFTFTPLDFKTVGSKVLTITYDNVSISFTYQVFSNEQLQVADASWYDSTKNTFELSTAAQLRGLAKLVNGDVELEIDPINFKGKTVKLTADIDLGNVMWTPIGEGARKVNGKYRSDLGNDYSEGFLGTFDGGNYTISNLTNKGYYATTTKSESYKSSNGKANINGYCFGLFGVLGDNSSVYSVVIKNVKFSNVNFVQSSLGSGIYQGVDAGAALVGYAFGKIDLKISNCEVLSGKILGIDSIAAILGRYEYQCNLTDGNLYIKDCTNKIGIESLRKDSDGKAGGIVGFSCGNLNLENNINEGTIIIPDGSHFGEILGFSDTNEGISLLTVYKCTTKNTGKELWSLSNPNNLVIKGDSFITIE